jgi:hypothetical protein
VRAFPRLRSSHPLNLVTSVERQKLSSHTTQNQGFPHLRLATMGIMVFS